jgi:catechol 2,3-dioxygenase-like lactoylglutathione lyase family enzyme
MAADHRGHIALAQASTRRTGHAATQQALGTEPRLSLIVSHEAATALPLEVTMRFTIHPELPALDIQRAHAWYAEKLGLQPVRVNGGPYEPGDAIDPDSELLYRTDTATFGVYRSHHAGRNRATAARLVVDDFDAAHSELLAAGVIFEDYDLGADFRTVDGVLVSPDGERTA